MTKQTTIVVTGASRVNWSIYVQNWLVYFQNASDMDWRYQILGWLFSSWKHVSKILGCQKIYTPLALISITCMFSNYICWNFTVKGMQVLFVTCSQYLNLRYQIWGFNGQSLFVHFNFGGFILSNVHICRGVYRFGVSVCPFIRTCVRSFVCPSVALADTCVKVFAAKLFSSFIPADPIQMQLQTV